MCNDIACTYNRIFRIVATETSKIVSIEACDVVLYGGSSGKLFGSWLNVIHLESTGVKGEKKLCIIDRNQLIFEMRMDIE